MKKIKKGEKYHLKNGDIVEYCSEVKERIEKDDLLYKSYLVKCAGGLFGIICGDMIVSEAI